MTTIFAEEALTPDGWRSNHCVFVSGEGRIEAVRAGEPAGADIRVPLLLPAPANLHSHTFQRAMAGLTEARGPDANDSFWTWRRLMYRFLDHLDPDQVEAIAAYAMIEMAEAGYGAVAEFHYLHHAPGGAPYASPAELSLRIAAAADTTGLGLTHLPVLYQRGGCDDRELLGGQLRFGSDWDLYARIVEAAEGARPHADSVVGAAAHSLRAVTPASLADAAALRPDAPFHIHIAEQIPEIDEVAAAYGARPVEWALANADIDARWCLIHCTHMTDDETKAVA